MPYINPELCKIYSFRASIKNIWIYVWSIQLKQVIRYMQCHHVNPSVTFLQHNINQAVIILGFAMCIVLITSETMYVPLVA